MKFSVTVTLKKDVLDPQGKVVQDTLTNLGMKKLKSIRQGKFFEIEGWWQPDWSWKKSMKCAKSSCQLIIENYKVNKL